MCARALAVLFGPLMVKMEKDICRAITLMQKRPVSRIAGHVSDVLAGQTRISGGSSETEVTEFADKPTGPSGVFAVITVTPVGRWPRT